MIDRESVSFAEAEGKARYPSVLNWGEVDQRLRASLWNRLYFFFDEYVVSGPGHYYYYVSPLHDILLREFVHRRHQFVNDFRRSFSAKEDCIEHWSNLFRKADYLELFDFLTFVLRDRDCPAEVQSAIEAALNEPWSPYRLVVGTRTIIPAVTQHQAEAIKRDVESVFASDFRGAQSHLQAALDALNSADYRDVVRESIHAVESAVRDFTGDPNAVLSKALKKLKEERRLHRALSDAFEKLYAYTSDENGIRHALVFENNDKVGLEESMFFVSACSAFVSFLASAANKKN